MPEREPTHPDGSDLMTTTSDVEPAAPGAAPTTHRRIEAKGLGKTFQTRNGPRAVLDGLDFRVDANEFVSIVGPSGAGKTTLLRCIAGLERPTAGGVYVDGDEVHEPPRQVALVFQDYGRSLYPWLRVEGNVALPLRTKRLSKKARRTAALEALEAVGLADAAHQYPWQLSGGMQQRVAIARALAYEPEALLMDEPFASVDAQTRSDLEDLVLSIRSRFDMTVILVTHDVDESVYMADRVLVLGKAPARIIEEVVVELPAERDQISTKSDPAFVSARTRVLTAVQNAKG
ncbi:ABC transporter ATP-binding protein [Streptomyces sp. NPDC004610]|uniref:ABC transporter ATP-binding protein n=1 Tax=unclassified Streptomyces TaxID=2593676 RepID=UPI0033B25B1D